MNGKWTSEEVRQLLLKIAGGPISVAQRVELFDIASEYAAILDAQGDGGAVELEYPEFHAQGMGCGLEDRGITDRYEAMRYGFDEALDQMARIIENAGPIYTHPARSGVVSDEDVRDAARYRWLRDDPPLELSVRRFPGETQRGCYLDGYALDQAIDAAIQGERHEH